MYVFVCVYLYTRACMCIWVHISIGTRCVGLPGARDPGSCESLDMHTENQTQVLHKSL